MLIYLDSSAIVKLVRWEPETRSLLSYLRSWPERVTSIVSAVEVPRAIRRTSKSSRVLSRIERVMTRIVVIQFVPAISARGAVVEPSTLRSLDAVHVATALDLGADLHEVVTYDGKQADAAREAGLSVVAPGRN